MSANRYPDWASVRLPAAAPADGPVAFCADVSAASVNRSLFEPKTGILRIA